MKKTKIIFTALFGLGSFTQALALPLEIDAPIEKIFIPAGFDDNDNVEIVLKGTFENTCYRIGNTRFKVDHERKTIQIEAKTYHYNQPDLTCLQVLTDFLQPIKIGMLPAGDYEVTVKKQKNLRQNLNVKARTTEAPDDFLYASVENAHIDIDYVTGKQSLVLQGHHPYWFHGCQVITEVRTFRDPVDVLVVQPISEVMVGEACDNLPTDRAFNKVVGLPSPFVEEGMIHVRSLNGASINRYIAPIF